VADLLLDTDLFVDHLRGASKLEPAKHRIHYSVITRAELFARNAAADFASRLLAPFREIATPSTSTASGGCASAHRADAPAAAYCDSVAAS